MSPNLVLTMGGALAKQKLGLGKLNGLERFLLSQLTLPDQVTTLLAATNIEPDLIDPKFDYVLLSQSLEANLELFGRVCEQIQADVIVVPVWMGTLTTGAAELGTKYKIEKRRVPYAVEFPIRSMADVAAMRVPEQAAGFLKMYFDINKEAQRRYPNTLVFPVFDGPWDLAMLLRGDHHLPADLRIHKDYSEAADPVRKDKIRRHGDPDLYPAIMELATRLAIRHIQLGVQAGLSLLGTQVMDQFACKPVLGREDYLRYVHPYREQVWKASGRKVTISYMCPSPDEFEENMQHPVLSKAGGGFTNYIFPQTPEGITRPEYDRPMFEMAKKYGQTYSYMVHGKYLRDATEAELEALVQRVCGLATALKAKMMLSIASVPPGASVERANFVFRLVDRYGRY